MFEQAGLEPCSISFGISFDQSDLYKAEMRCSLSSLLELLPASSALVEEQIYLVHSTA